MMLICALNVYPRSCYLLGSIHPLRTQSIPRRTSLILGTLSSSDWTSSIYKRDYSHPWDPPQLGHGEVKVWELPQFVIPNKSSVVA